MHLLGVKNGGIGVSQASGLEKLALDSLNVFYSVGEDEYIYANDEYLILVDTIMDKSRREEFDANIARLTDSYRKGAPLDGEIFRGAYFIVIIDKRASAITLVRDSSGVKTGYYLARDGFVCAGNNMHQVALSSGVREFNEEAVHQMLYLDYLFDGCTYYDSVVEVRVGETIAFNRAGKAVSAHREPLKLSDGEAVMSLAESTGKLREEIRKAHAKFACDDNAVLLSGGLDSAVMLISLDDLVSKDKISSYSYRVKGVLEDETVYGKSMADHLGVKNLIVEIDSEDKENYKGFEEKVLLMNNPYLGMWIFGNLKGATLTRTYYAGQDTRLHTPDLNPIDKLAFKLFIAARNPIVGLASGLLGRAAKLFHPEKLSESRNRYARVIARLFAVLDSEIYILKYFFKLDRDELIKQGLPLEHYDAIKDRFRMDLGRIKNQRALYNEIVRIKWGEQYTDDIRYIQDMAKLNRTYIAMPFYDSRLASFSSAIPFGQATMFMVGKQRYSSKKSIINKYLLRTAFRNKLNDMVFYRQKATSNTLYLLFNGALGNVILDTLKGDLAGENSFIARYCLGGFLDRYLKGGPWQPDDHKYLLKVYYIAMLCIYNRRVLKGRS